MPGLPDITVSTETLQALADGGWPAKVRAFRPELAVHGRFGQA